MSVQLTPAELAEHIGRAAPINPYYEQGANLSQDDWFTLAGITMAGPGLGKGVRERFVAIAASLLKKHGLRAFEMPKRAAATHEAGHVVINSAVGVRTTSVLIDHIHRNGALHWIGHTDAPDLAFVDAPNAPAGIRQASYAGADDLRGHCRRASFRRSRPAGGVLARRNPNVPDFG